MAAAERSSYPELPAGGPGDLSDLRERGAPGIGLCLSGGGYRAMLFHVGALWRLYESGLLKQAKRTSSVSGGSITAGLLALKWSGLPGDPAVGRSDFVRELVGPIRRLARRSGRECRNVKRNDRSYDTDARKLPRRARRLPSAHASLRVCSSRF